MLGSPKSNQIPSFDPEEAHAFLTRNDERLARLVERVGEAEENPSADNKKAHDEAWTRWKELLKKI